METICHQKKLNEPKVFFQKPKEKTIEKHEKNTTDAEPTPQKIPGKHFQKSPVFDRKSNHLSPCCTFKADPADPWCFPWYFLFSCLEYPQRKTATPQKNVGVWNISVQNCPKKQDFLVGRFNNHLKNHQIGISSRNGDEKKTCLKPPPVSQFMGFGFGVPFGVSNLPTHLTDSRV